MPGKSFLQVEPSDFLLYFLMAHVFWSISAFSDPLAELVKLEAKSIGVGQYQHDVNQTELKKGLEDVVVSCVNSVGVQVNNTSPELLTFVSGLGPVLATNIIAFRDEHGPFSSRKEFLKVPRLGAKAFEQCAGFLRIHGVKKSSG